MKTAIIFYGFFRTFDFVKHTLKENVLDVLDCDVFFNTFETIEAKKINENNQDIVDEKIINFFGDKLKKYEINKHEPEKDKQFLIDNNLPDYNDFCKQETYKIVSMQRALTKSINLFKKYIEENNEKYDEAIENGLKIKNYPCKKMWGIGTPEDRDIYLNSLK
jgi:hypothetical protein